MAATFSTAAAAVATVDDFASDTDLYLFSVAFTSVLAYVMMLQGGL